MDIENKKISFGFSKIAKKTPNIQPQIEKPELIDCLEGSEIKVKNPVVKVEKKSLVIAIKGNPNNLVSRIQTQALKSKEKKKNEEEDTRPDSELTIEELAARQLIREAREKLAQKKETAKVHTLPLVEEITTLDAQESTMDDYENVPINDYGMAMLRGMGWKEGMCIGKNQSNFVKPPDPELRPKGLGLGAQKMIQPEQEDVFDKNGKQLVLAKGAFAKITAGPHKGTFCEVQGLDDEAGRIIVKMSRTNDILTLNELFVKPVTKEEYALGSKVINNAKYEQYKENETKVKSERDSKYGEKSKSNHRKREESEDSVDHRGRRRREEDSEDTSDEYRRNRSSRHELKEDSDVSTDEYKRSRSEKNYNKNDSKTRKQSKSRYRSRDKYKKERRNSSDSSSDEKYSKRKPSKHTRRRNSEDSDKRKSSKDRTKSYKHKHSKSRNDSRSDD